MLPEDLYQRPTFAHFHSTKEAVRPEHLYIREIACAALSDAAWLLNTCGLSSFTIKRMLRKRSASGLVACKGAAERSGVWTEAETDLSFTILILHWSVAEESEAVEYGGRKPLETIYS